MEEELKKLSQEIMNGKENSVSEKDIAVNTWHKLTTLFLNTSNKACVKLFPRNDNTKNSEICQ